MPTHGRFADARLPDIAPVFPLPGALLLPGGGLPLNIFEPRYVEMVDDALAGDRCIGMIQPESDAELEKALPRLARIGCLGRITQFAETEDGRYLVVLSGLSRFRVVEEERGATRYRRCRVDYATFSDAADPNAGEELVDRGALLAAFRAYADAKNMEIEWDSVDEASTATLTTVFSSMGSFGLQEKQALLEAPTLVERAETLIALARFETIPGNSPLQ